MPYVTEARKATLSLDGLDSVTMSTNNILVVTLGNIVGGLIFVGLLYSIAFRKDTQALK